MGHTVIALHTVLWYTRIFGWIWGKNGIWQSSDRIWACSRLFFFSENGNIGFWKPLLGFWKPSESIGACSRLFFFLKNGNMGFLKPILGFWKPSESIGACSRLFFFPLKNSNLGFWKVSTRLLRTHTVIRYTVIAWHTVIAYPHGY